MSSLNIIEEVPFSAFDRAALADLIGRVARPGCRMAEVGSWMGLGSTQTFLASLAQVPDSTLICVDTWRGAPSCDHDRGMADEHDIFGIFRKNAFGADGGARLVPVVSDSAAAATLMRDGWFDLVFIDADHSYDSVKADIAAWLPKVRPGGILCGHDCESGVLPQDRAFLVAARHRDAIEVEEKNFRHYHAGVILAVHEAFAGEASLFAESAINLPDRTYGRSSIWYVTVPRSPLLKLQRNIGRALGIGRPHRKEIAPAAAPKSVAPNAPLLMGTIGAYNVVYFKEKFIGLPQSLGPIELEQEDLQRLPEGVYLCDSYEELQSELLKISATPAKHEQLHRQ
jgi:Methyltransferase domain